MNTTGFAGRLRELREKVGLTQQQLADKAGMHREGVAQLERDRRQPSWESVLALARALGVEVSAFVVEGLPSAEPAPPRPHGRPRKDEGAGKKKGKRKRQGG